MSVMVIAEQCDPKQADDKTLPTNAYLVSYEVDGEIKYDIVMSGKQVDIFDQYYDKYKKSFKGMRQSAGCQRPNLWVDKNNKSNSRKRKKRSSAEKEQ